MTVSKWDNKMGEPSQFEYKMCEMRSLYGTVCVRRANVVVCLEIPSRCKYKTLKPKFTFQGDRSLLSPALSV